MVRRSKNPFFPDPGKSGVPRSFRQAENRWTGVTEITSTSNLNMNFMASNLNFMAFPEIDFEIDFEIKIESILGEHHKVQVGDHEVHVRNRS